MSSFVGWNVKSEAIAGVHSRILLCKRFLRSLASLVLATLLVGLSLHRLTGFEEQKGKKRGGDLPTKKKKNLK